MTDFIHFAPLATAALFSAVWQGALLAVGVALCLRLLPGITAAARSLAWAAVFLLMLVLPFTGNISASSLAQRDAGSFHFDPRWAVGVVMVWVALSILRGIRLLQSAVRLRRLVSHSSPFDPTAEVAALLAATKPRVRLCLSSEVDTPSVAGFFDRRILLPRELAEHIVPADLQQIVLHELEHLRRRDDWTNLLQKLALVVFPLNPILLWVERRLCVERELACDDGVLHATGGAAKAYAICLTNLAEAAMLHRGLSLALGAWQRRTELARRVHRILHNPVRQMKAAHSATLATLIVSALCATTVLAARGPQLISFSAAPDAGFTARAAMAQGQPLQLQPQRVHVALVRATVDQPRLVPATLRVSRKHVERHRTPTTGVRRYGATPNLVLIGWQPDQFRGTRWAGVSQSFQLTYAAVPTRSGWLFFQL